MSELRNHVENLEILDYKTDDDYLRNRFEEIKRYFIEFCGEISISYNKTQKTQSELDGWFCQMMDLVKLMELFRGTDSRDFRDFIKSYNDESKNKMGFCFDASRDELVGSLNYEIRDYRLRSKQIKELKQITHDLMGMKDSLVNAVGGIFRSQYKLKDEMTGVVMSYTEQVRDYNASVAKHRLVGMAHENAKKEFKALIGEVVVEKIA